MKKEDVGAVAAIEKSCFSQPWTENGFIDAIENPTAFFWVAEENSQILGYLGMYESIDEGEITNVAVDDRFRCRGIGRALIEAAQEHAGEQGIARVVLEVRTGNTAAIALYGSCGFERVGVRRDFYEFPREDADIMVWINKRTKIC
jgi:ribosomal-protein-alanine N-acetyltransferase